MLKSTKTDDGRFHDPPAPPLLLTRACRRVSRRQLLAAILLGFIITVIIGWSLMLTGCATTTPNNAFDSAIFHSGDDAFLDLIHNMNITDETQLAAAIMAVNERDRMKAEEARRVENERTENARKAEADKATAKTLTQIGGLLMLVGAAMTIIGFWKIKALIIPGLVAVGLGLAFVILPLVLHDVYVLWSIRILIGGGVVYAFLCAWDHLITYRRYVKKRIAELRACNDPTECDRIMGDLEGTARLYGRQVPQLV